MIQPYIGHKKGMSLMQIDKLGLFSSSEKFCSFSKVESDPESTISQQLTLSWPLFMNFIVCSATSHFLFNSYKLSFAYPHYCCSFRYQEIESKLLPFLKKSGFKTNGLCSPLKHIMPLWLLLCKCIDTLSKITRNITILLLG